MDFNIGDTVLLTLDKKAGKVIRSFESLDDIALHYPRYNSQEEYYILTRKVWYQDNNVDEYDPIYLVELTNPESCSESIKYMLCPGPLLSLIKNNCCCGVDTLGYGIHSQYCDKYKISL